MPLIRSRGRQGVYPALGASAARRLQNQRYHSIEGLGESSLNTIARPRECTTPTSHALSRRDAMFLLLLTLLLGWLSRPEPTPRVYLEYAFLAEVDFRAKLEPRERTFAQRQHFTLQSTCIRSQVAAGREVLSGRKDQLPVPLRPVHSSQPFLP